MQDGASSHSPQPSCVVWGMFADRIKGQADKMPFLFPSGQQRGCTKPQALWAAALGAGGCGGVWEGWRSPGAFGGNSWVHLGPLPTGGIHPLQFHLLLATVQGRLGHKLCWERAALVSRAVQVIDKRVDKLINILIYQ